MPVEMVSWNDCQKFIRRLNKIQGTGKYRLPTEAEWEYASRAESTTAFANGGITETGRGHDPGDPTDTGCGHDPNLDVMGWYCGNSGNKTHPVAQKKPNAWGLYDMQGNVWEWCQDRYGGYRSAPVTNPEGSSSASKRVGRGGGWNYGAWACRSANRDNDGPSRRLNNVGFRLAKDE